MQIVLQDDWAAGGRYPVFARPPRRPGRPSRRRRRKAFPLRKGPPDSPRRPQGRLPEAVSGWSAPRLACGGPGPARTEGGRWSPVAQDAGKAVRVHAVWGGRRPGSPRGSPGPSNRRRRRLVALGAPRPPRLLRLHAMSAWSAPRLASRMARARLETGAAAASRPGRAGRRRGYPASTRWWGGRRLGGPP
jgi:hypothetical protein